jgi:hypothetical protein
MCSRVCQLTETASVSKATAWTRAWVRQMSTEEHTIILRQRKLWLLLTRAYLVGLWVILTQLETSKFRSCLATNCYVWPNVRMRGHRNWSSILLGEGWNYSFRPNLEPCTSCIEIRSVSAWNDLFRLDKARFGNTADDKHPFSNNHHQCSSSATRNRCAVAHWCQVCCKFLLQTVFKYYHIYCVRFKMLY